MENVIFLDFDGVINNNYDDITIEAIITLKFLIKNYNAKVVVISSNLQNGTIKRKNKLISFLNNLEIYNVEFIDPNYQGKYYHIELNRRILEIIDYLKLNSNIKYVILDDEFDKKYSMLNLNCFKTDRNTGLKRDDFLKISFKSIDFSNINKVEYRYRTLGAYEKATNDLIYVLKLIKEKKDER